MEINIEFTTTFVVAFLIIQVCYLYILITHLRRNDCSDTDKIVWTIVLCTLNILGAILYLAIGNKTTSTTPPPSNSNNRRYTSSNGNDCTSCGRIMKLGHRKCEYCGCRS